jgi:hypothetical protein
MTSTGAISQTSGVRQFVVGTGGRSTNAVRGKTGTQFKYQGFGLLDLSLGSTSYSWSFITTSGQRLDAGTASCR